ncbi:alginate export family protein [uncultured Sphingomonas sp.]|jgi:hypothetical protein|uniref:alginate export family protein n=1 Tax=uncultured Sphingomonas sp. TaxID=158754 RepID=UPI0025FE8700|nr:alginate export family protein [uncultured Sphingomonas sp.]
MTRKSFRDVASRSALAALLFVAAGGSAWAQTPAGTDQIRVKPILDARLRYEGVDQPTIEADALTLRLRAGAEVWIGPASVLAEGEGTVAPIDDYNAFPFMATSNRQFRPGFAVVPDPENIELNRLQLQLRTRPAVFTVGRQRINLDDQRWVGSVAWRQNEQTFDALRGEAKLGPATLDLTYAIGQRTIFGNEAGPRRSYDGDFVFAGVAAPFGPLQGKLFAYLLDYDEAFYFANSSQSYGGILAASVPVAGKKLNLRASYARQRNYGANPFTYAADYVAAEAGTALAGFTISAGWEKLGSDNGRGLQTPMATLHKFNGWADLFLTTPGTGLEDAYFTIARRFDGVRLLPGLNANLTWHQFDSDVGDLEYGTEIDASIGFKVKQVALLLKYADYREKGFGLDTRKLWLQAEWAF